ncbi:DNA topoisomerase I, mitochondrial-like [Ruditapes philippinarum]|uniref:DNA topoisomerase I, mitochondrial-like n=1 Tax=Ruditapes philippinarum TaxID=129788 RepID=UPI00295BCB64|nr:DNA topoisomerase I, mitochondrial-like [Ruditapes philippinarum]
MDGHKEKIGNFRTESPGLFRGRGDNPKQGLLKRRIQPEDVVINCSRLYEKKEKAYNKAKEQLTRLEVQATTKVENKEFALGTSKLHYLDPRISVAWCKKWKVPVENV